MMLKTKKRVNVILFAAIAAVMFCVFSGVFVSAASAQNGKTVFKQKDCAACHRTSRPEVGFSTDDPGSVMMPGPELWYAGEKLKPGFVKQWLQNPIPIRPLAYNSVKVMNPNDHPRLSKTDSRDITAYLMTLKSQRAKTYGIKVSYDSKMAIVFEKKLGCYGCHRITQEGAVFGGLSGPTLVRAGLRLNPDWIYAFLNDPAYYTPRMTMPIYKGQIEDKNMKKLSAFVASFK